MNFLPLVTIIKAPLERIRQLEEALKIIKLMFTQDGPSHSGKYYSITDVECYPKPIQKPYPPIMVGGTGEKHLHIGLHVDKDQFSVERR